MKYRTKPIIVDAIQFTRRMFDWYKEVPEGVKYKVLENGETQYIQYYIETLEGPLNVSIGDYIITGVKGEKYPCKPDIFKLTHEKVEE